MNTSYRSALPQIAARNIAPLLMFVMLLPAIATNPADADPGTIRKDFAASIEENVVHGSDGPDTAAQEIAFFFGDDGICPRTR